MLCFFLGKSVWGRPGSAFIASVTSTGGPNHPGKLILKPIELIIHLPLDADLVNLSPSSLLNRSPSLDRLLGEFKANSSPLPGCSMFLTMSVAPGNQTCANPPGKTIPNSIAPSLGNAAVTSSTSVFSTTSTSASATQPHLDSAGTSASGYAQLQPSFFQASNPSSLASSGPKPGASK